MQLLMLHAVSALHTPAVYASSAYGDVNTGTLLSTPCHNLKVQSPTVSNTSGRKGFTCTDSDSTAEAVITL